jgi:hypothetical protein
LHPPTTIKFIDGWFASLFTWVVIIKLVNIIWIVPTTPIIAISSVALQFKFLLTKTPLDPLHNFVANLISIPPLTTFMLGATTISTHVVVMIDPLMFMPHFVTPHV